MFARTEQCHQAISGRSQKLFLESQNHGIWRESESQLPFFRSLLDCYFFVHMPSGIRRFQMSRQAHLNQLDAHATPDHGGRALEARQCDVVLGAEKAVDLSAACLEQRGHPLF